MEVHNALSALIIENASVELGNKRLTMMDFGQVHSLNQQQKVNLILRQ